MRPKIVVKDDAAPGELYIRKSEMAVIRHICDGKTAREIALELGLAASTVENHRSNAIKRTHSHNMCHLIHMLHVDKILSEDGNNPA